MHTHDVTTEEMRPEENECAAPSLAESLLALGLLFVTIVGCWLVYGPAIRMMPAYIEHVLRR